MMGKKVRIVRVETRNAFVLYLDERGKVSKNGAERKFSPVINCRIMDQVGIPDSLVRYVKWIAVPVRYAV